MSGTISPQGQIMVPASALQQGNVTVTAVNPTQVVAGMSPWHTAPPSGTARSHLLQTSRHAVTRQVQNMTKCVCVPGGTVYQPVTVVTPQGQVVTQALSPGTIRVQNNQVLPVLHVSSGVFTRSLYECQHMHVSAVGPPFIALQM